MCNAVAAQREDVQREGENQRGVSDAGPDIPNHAAGSGERRHQQRRGNDARDSNSAKMRWQQVTVHSDQYAIMGAMILDPAIGILIVASIALLFASAAVHKLRDLKRFDEIFTAYGLAPMNAGSRISWIVPMLEMTVAAGLIVKVSRLYAAALGIIMLSGYAVAIAVNLRRGHRDLACGCGGPDERRTIAAWMVWRNVLVALAVAAIFAPWSARQLSITDALTIAFGLLTIALVYLCIDQLFGNAQRTAQMWGSR
jgi:Methylamine utilisation protein MauE